MRTTVTLEPDVVARVRALMRQQDLSFKQALNQALRAGLGGPTSRRRRGFRARTYKLGFSPGVNFNKALALVTALEDEETARKLGLNK